MPNRLIDGRGPPIKRNGIYRQFIGALITALVAFIFYRLGDDPWIDQIPDGGVLVLHMMGSHGPAYYKRYPREHAKFTPDCQDTQFSRCTREALVNAYDNTIAYTDHVLRLVVGRGVVPAGAEHQHEAQEREKGSRQAELHVLLRR